MRLVGIGILGALTAFSAVTVAAAPPPLPAENVTASPTRFKAAPARATTLSATETAVATERRKAATAAMRTPAATLMATTTRAPNAASATATTAPLQSNAAAILATAVGASPTGSPSPSALTATPHNTTPVPKLTMAFFYPWWGTPQGPTGEWSHWYGNPYGLGIPLVTDHPYAFYDSRDPATIKNQISLASQAGINTLITSWWGAGDLTDTSFNVILNTAASANSPVSFAAQLETPGFTSMSDSGISDQLAYLLGNYGNRPSYLHVNGRPVVFVYNPAALTVDWTRWQAIIHASELATYNALFLVDDFDPGGAAVFDGLYIFGALGPNIPLDPEHMLQSYVYGRTIASQAGKIFMATAVPGFDNYTVHPPGWIVPRYDSATYWITWLVSLLAEPDWMALESWNEWHEASELEPSLEYGTSYLDLTAQWNALFKGPGLPISPGQAQSLLSNPEAAFSTHPGVPTDPHVPEAHQPPWRPNPSTQSQPRRSSAEVGQSKSSSPSNLSRL